MKIFIIVVSFLLAVFCYNKKKQNAAFNNNLSAKTQQIDSSVIKKIVGNWTSTKKEIIDSITITSVFTLNIIEKKDSILGQYVNILGNGDEINAGDDSSDYSFRISKKDFYNILVNQSYFSIVNWEGGPNKSDDIAYLKLSYLVKKDLLVWELRKASKWLPTNTILHRGY